MCATPFSVTNSFLQSIEERLPPPGREAVHFVRPAPQAERTLSSTRTAPRFVVGPMPPRLPRRRSRVAVRVLVAQDVALRGIAKPRRSVRCLSGRNRACTAYTAPTLLRAPTGGRRCRRETSNFARIACGMRGVHLSTAHKPVCLQGCGPAEAQCGSQRRRPDRRCEDCGTSTGRGKMCVHTRMQAVSFWGRAVWHGRDKARVHGLRGVVGKATRRPGGWRSPHATSGEDQGS